MAKEAAQKKPAPPAPEEAAAPKKPRRRKLFALLGALVLAAVGAGAFVALDPIEPGAPRPETPKPPQYVNLEPFTVNLRDEGAAAQYLQLGLVYQVAGGEPAEAMKLNMPLIRSSILLLLSGKTASELATLEGKGRLSAELLAAARAPLPGEGPGKGIAAVHFSAFIIQ
jgi:flagellar FliL protein